MKASACCVFWAPFIPPGELSAGKLNLCAEVWCCVHIQVFSCQCSLCAFFLNALFPFLSPVCSVGCCHNGLLPTNCAQPHVMVGGTHFSSLGACTLVSVPCCTVFFYVWTAAGGFLYFIYLVFVVDSAMRLLCMFLGILLCHVLFFFNLKANMCK